MYKMYIEIMMLQLVEKKMIKMLYTVLLIDCYFLLLLVLLVKLFIRFRHKKHYNIFTEKEKNYSIRIVDVAENRRDVTPPGWD
jgi:hypothetical protein